MAGCLTREFMPSRSWSSGDLLDDRRKDLLPIVRYTIQRKIAKGKPDYWDYATLLELAVVEGNQDNTAHALAGVLANIRESWEPESTARNVRLIREARQARGEKITFEADVEKALTEAQAAAKKQ